MTNKHSQRTWWWLKCAGSLFSGSLLCMFGTDRVQGRREPLILSLGRPRCSCEGQCQVCFICRGNARPLYVQLIRHKPKRNVCLCRSFVFSPLLFVWYNWLSEVLTVREVFAISLDICDCNISSSCSRRISWLAYFNQTMLTVLLSLLEKSSYLCVSYLLLLFLKQEDKITVVPNRRHVSEGRFSQ